MIGLLIELLAFACLVGGFLWIYFAEFGASIQAITPHVMLAASAIGAVGGLRAVMHRVLPARMAGGFAALLLSVLFGTMALYYALVLVGLQSWGRVVTWRLISTYAAQAGDLLSVIGWSPWAVAASLVVASVVLHAMTWSLLRRHDFTRIAAQRASPFAFWTASALLIVLFAVEVAVLIQDPRPPEGEPVALTFFPERAAEQTQHHRFGGNAGALSADRAARAAYRPAAPAARANVILIVGDALRGDHLHVAGYARETTPYLSALAAAGRAQVATNVRSVCAESTCGLMGIAKSAFVHELTGESISLLEVLDWNGYRTRLLLSGDHTNFYSLRTAYGPVDDYFDSSMASHTYMNDDRLLLQQVEALPAWDGTPEFIQFHLMSAHVAGQRFGEQRWTPQHNYYSRRSLKSTAAPDPEAVNYFDNGVRQFDAMVSGLLGRLELRGYLSNAIVVITGDHGEMLGEYGGYAHASSVREGALRVPFVILGFGVALQPFVEPDELASQVDIAPTILAQLGLPAPASWHGFPLQAARPARFVPFQQGLLVGVYEPGTDGQALKYWRDLGSGVEYVARVDARSEADLPHAAGLARLRVASLAAGANAAPSRID